MITKFIFPYQYSDKTANNPFANFFFCEEELPRLETDVIRDVLSKNERRPPELESLGQINVFIGQNNSGKSRFLRSIFLHLFFHKHKSKTYKPLFVYNFVVQKSLLEEFKRLILPQKHVSGKYVVQYEKFKTELIKAINDFHEEGELNHITLLEMHENFNILIDSLYSKEFISEILFLESEEFNPRDEKHRLKESLDSLIKHKKETDPFLVNAVITYVPILRGIKSLEIGKTHYYDRTQTDYFKQFSINGSDRDLIEPYIFTGEDFYERVDSGHSDNKEEFEAFETFLGKWFFNGERVSLTARKKTLRHEDEKNGQEYPNSRKNIYIKVGKERMFPIHELGDGVQAIILLAFPLFMNKGKKHYYFIEEPENYLHAGFQKVFINTVAKEFPETQLFIVSHSNHILEMSGDKTKNMSVYKFSKYVLKTNAGNDIVPHFLVDNISSAPDNVLDDLGVSATSVFLANCTIWVEGITDRLYISKYLELYQLKHDKAFIEGYHFAFVEYAGSNLPHWDFDASSTDTSKINAKKISKKIFLVADKDDTDDSPEGEKAKRLTELEELLSKDNFYKTTGKEMENLLSPSVLKKVVLEYEGETDATFEFVFKDYKDINIGKYIEDLLGKNKKRRGSYKEGNTISDKSKFCQRAVAHMESYDDMSGEAKELTKKIVSFVEKHNPSLR